jgi:hypothetical protein
VKRFCAGTEIRPRKFPCVKGLWFLTGKGASQGLLFMTENNQLARTATQAREGVTGHNVRYVLIASLAGIIILFAGLWLYFFA